MYRLEMSQQSDAVRALMASDLWKQAENEENYVRRGISLAEHLLGTHAEVLRLAAILEIKGKDLARLRDTALFHDIGKLRMKWLPGGILQGEYHQELSRQVALEFGIADPITLALIKQHDQPYALWKHRTVNQHRTRSVWKIARKLAPGGSDDEARRQALNLVVFSYADRLGEPALDPDAALVSPLYYEELCCEAGLLREPRRIYALALRLIQS